MASYTGPTVAEFDEQLRNESVDIVEMKVTDEDDPEGLGAAQWLVTPVTLSVDETLDLLPDAGRGKQGRGGTVVLSLPPEAHTGDL